MPTHLCPRSGQAGAQFAFSSYFGGSNLDLGEGIAVDKSNYIYVTGFTASTNFPVSNAIIMQTIGTNVYNGQLLNDITNPVAGFAYDAFVAKFTPGFGGLFYSTYLGGINNDMAYSVAPDANGNAYVTGQTVSTNYPITLTNLPGDQNGLTNNAVYGILITNAFLTQIVWNGTNAAIGSSVAFGRNKCVQYRHRIWIGA